MTSPRLTWAQGLRGRFITLLLISFLVTGVAILILFSGALEQLTGYLGERFATQYALREANRIDAAITREVALSRTLAASPLLVRWAQDEQDPDLKAAALAELENYRRNFRDRSYAFIVAASGNYYFDDLDAPPQGSVAYTLSREKPADAWFYSTLDQVEEFALNVNHDEHLNKTKIWINAIIGAAEGKRLGVAGTGIDLTRFLKETLGSGRDGVELVLFDGEGAVKAHPNPELIDYATLTKTKGERRTIFQLVEGDEAALSQAMKGLREGHAAHTLSLHNNGRKYLAAVTYLPSIDWYLIAFTDLSNLAALENFIPLLVLLAAAPLAAMLLMAALLNRGVITPISRLTHTVQEISSGDYTVRVENRERGEIGALGDAFNQMAGKIQHYTDHLEELVTTRTRELEEANHDLNVVNHKMVESIRAAHMIQASVLPKEVEMERTLRDHFVIWKPRDVVGGDFYYLHSGPKGILLAVVDCTGHGVPGAFMSMTANSVLNHVVGALCADDPARILQETNRILRETLYADRPDEGADNGLDIGLCHWAPGGGELTFAGAQISLYHHHGDGLSEYRGERRGIGYWGSDPDRPFSNRRIPLRDAEAFYLLSDGVLDQAGGARGFGFGRRRLLDALAGGAGASMKEQGARLEAIVATYQGSRPQRDDITVVGFVP